MQRAGKLRFRSAEMGCWRRLMSSQYFAMLTWLWSSSLRKEDFMNSQAPSKIDFSINYALFFSLNLHFSTKFYSLDHMGCCTFICVLSVIVLDEAKGYGMTFNCISWHQVHLISILVYFNFLYHNFFRVITQIVSFYISLISWFCVHNVQTIWYPLKLWFMRLSFINIITSDGDSN